MGDTILCLSIDSCSRSQSSLLAWCRAITVAGAVFGTVLASIPVRDYGISLVAILGIFSYLLVIADNLGGMAVARVASGRPAGN